MVSEIDRFEVAALQGRGAQVVEVLPYREYRRRHIAGAVSLPLPEVASHARRRLDPHLPVVTYCYDATCDMSGRAAAVLDCLGFAEVYNYQPSKVDWFSNGLPAEGEEATLVRLADLVDRSVPRCRVDESLDDVAVRMGNWDRCVVVAANGAVLGVITRDDVRAVAGTATPVADLIHQGPITYRPDLTVDEMAAILRRQPQDRVLVTNADGTLVGTVDATVISQAAGVGAEVSRETSTEMG